MITGSTSYSAGAASAGCSRLETFLFFSSSRNWPTCKSFSVKFSISCNCNCCVLHSDHRGILWQARDLLAPVRLRWMTSSAAAGRPMCSRAANDVPHSVYQRRVPCHPSRSISTGWATRPPRSPERFKSDSRYRSANTASFIAIALLSVHALRRFSTHLNKWGPFNWKIGCQSNQHTATCITLWLNQRYVSFFRLTSQSFVKTDFIIMSPDWHNPHYTFNSSYK